MVPALIQTNPGNSLDVAFYCDYAEVRIALDAVTAFLREHRFTEEEIMACELALAEGCNNAVRYVDEEGRQQRIQVQAVCTEARVMFWVHDHTPGFEWPKKIELPDGDAENGRGLYLMTSLMEEVHYYRGSHENILHLSKARLAPVPESPAGEEESRDEMKRRLAESDQIITDMAEELSFCYESLAAIFRHSADQGHGGTKAEFARRLLNDLIQIIAADWYVLRLLPNHGNSLNFLVASESLFSEQPIMLPGPDETVRSVEVEATITRQNVWFDQHRALRPGDPLGQIKPGANGVVHPIFFGERLMGTLVLGRNLTRAPFTAGQLNVVGTFSDFLAIQFVNAEIQEGLINSRLNERELEIARTIQQSLILREIPSVLGMKLSGHCESARQVGGDFFDVMECGEGRLLLVIADVMGKGIPAAMFAAILRSLFRALPRSRLGPSELLEQANVLLFQELSAVDMFITVQLVQVDGVTRKVQVANAGHCPALLYQPGNGGLVKLSPDGMPLGIIPDLKFATEEVQLKEGSRMLIYTDGLAETRDSCGEFFGYERLARWLKSAGQSGADVGRMKDELVMEMARFQRGDVLQDDQTFLILAG